MVTAVLPLGLRQRLRALQRKYQFHSTPIGSVDSGDLRRLSPIGPIFWLDRALLTVERYYIEYFPAANSEDVKGRVLEIGDPAYTNKFGGDRVTQSDLLNYVEGNSQAKIVADLMKGDNIPDDSFDCIIITQILQMIFDIRGAIATLHRIMKLGGVVLATSHGITPLARRKGVDDWGEYWHFTSQSSKHLFQEAVSPEHVKIETYGNVLSTIASLHGLAAGDLDPEEIDFRDPKYELLVMVRAEKDR